VSDNNWARWDAEHRHERLSGPAGRKALKNQGVDLVLRRMKPSYGGQSERVRTHVRMDGHPESIGVIDHPGPGESHYFAFYKDKEGFVKSSEAHVSHDRALRAVLAHRGVKTPHVTPEDERAARVTGPSEHSTVVLGPYSGKRAAPSRDMSAAGRFADSTATRIRMNNPRTPTTAEQLAARSMKPSTVAAVKRIYGDLIKYHRGAHGSAGRKGQIDVHLHDLSQLPEAHHRFLAQHMRGVGGADAGLHLGEIPTVKMKGTQPYYADTLAKAGAPSWEPKGGWRSINYMNLAHVVISGDPGGSLATAAHEQGHTMDRALGEHLSGVPGTDASTLPHFRQVYNEVTHAHDDGKTLLNPYYTDDSTSHGPAEMFAEGYDAHNYYRGAPNRDEMIGRAIGAAPDQRVRVGRALGRYFDIHDQTIAKAVRT
jgi:hypothetical protein